MSLLPDESRRSSPAFLLKGNYGKCNHQSQHPRPKSSGRQSNVRQSEPFETYKRWDVRLSNYHLGKFKDLEFAKQVRVEAEEHYRQSFASFQSFVKSLRVLAALRSKAVRQDRSNAMKLRMASMSAEERQTHGEKISRAKFGQVRKEPVKREPRIGTKYSSTLSEFRSALTQQRMASMSVDELQVHGEKISRSKFGQVRSDSRSGVAGVVWNTANSKWQVTLIFRGVRTYLGRFKDKEAAIAARRVAERNLCQQAA